MNKTTRGLIYLLIVTMLVTIAFQIYKLAQPKRTQHIDYKEVVPQKRLDALMPHRYPTYPDPQLTPGDVVNYPKEVICKSGYSNEERQVKQKTKKKVYAEYHVSYPQPKGSEEVDHYIPLCIGGSNNIANLWLQPAMPYPGYHEKDALEQYVCRAVCREGKMTIQEGQNLFRTDWFEAYKKYIKPKK